MENAAKIEHVHEINDGESLLHQVMVAPSEPL